MGSSVILESLTHYFQNNGTYVPGIAEEWELSEDYLTFTLKLREGVKLHDGTEFTTKDVEATFYCLYPRMDRPWYLGTSSAR
jgi:peptide/nickel transport system substrate-binding protein